MAEIAALKGLQAQLNEAFEAVYAAQDAGSVARTKETLTGLAHATAGVAMGPAFGIIGFVGLPVQFMTIRVLVDLKVFELLQVKPQSLNDLAKASGADPRSLKRFLRMGTSIGWLKQVGVEEWESTPLSQMAALPPFKAWLMAHFETRMPTYTGFPEWFRKHDFKTTWKSDEDNIWMQANGEPMWEYMASHPEYSAVFDTAMSIQEVFPPEMIPPYPFDDDLDSIKTTGDEVTLVDVGGGFGQTIESIKQRHPNLSGKFILQDLPKTVDVIDAAKAQSVGFEATAHDFFTEQPVKGAKYYHLRRILHDWNDDKALEILKATRPAMDPAYSKLIIQDFVLPDLNAGLFESQIDLFMMLSCDGQERSESDWRALLARAGFKIDRILRPEVGATSVIEASVA